MSSTHESHWQQYTEGVEPCLLALPETTESAKAPPSEAIVLPTLPLGPVRDVDLLAALAAAWGLVLSFYCGTQEEVCFGIQDRRGKHVSTTMCRMHTNPELALDACLSKIQDDLADGSQFAFRTLRELQIATGRTAAEHLCNTAIVTCEFDLPEGFFDAGEYDAVVFLKDATTIGLRYRPSLMSRDTATNMAAALHQAFVSIMDPQVERLGDIQVVSTSQMKQLRRWNGNSSSSAHQLVHRAFELQAQRTPDAPAIWAWDGAWTYAELERLSSCLAQHLKSLGICPEVPVLLCFDKTKWHVLASLAVLKAGGVCASVDPAHPSSRLKTIAQTARADIVICTEDLASKMSEIVASTIALSSGYMSNLVGSIGLASFTSPLVGPDNAAFIVFTSGSTGKPKGIVQQHGAFCWASDQFQPLIGTKPGRRVLQFAAYTFDISIVDTFITLMHGACLCIPSAHERLNDLAGFISRAGVNQACITPTVARTLQPQEIPSLEVLCLAGEQVTSDNITTWTGKVDLINAYGPAEVSVAVLCKENINNTTHPADTGKPIGGGCWVVNKQNYHQLAPIGAIGELLVEGPHVARGYLHDEEKTKAAFIEAPRWLQKPLETIGQHRLYRTGDLVRYQPDGSIFFVGRADTQVKVRGQRVELGEIEHQIYTSKLASDAVVIYPKSGILSKSLVAVVSFPGVSSVGSVDDMGISMLDFKGRVEAESRVQPLKKHLESVLPHYMVPSTWISLPSLPSSSSGKLDRKLLQDWVVSIDGHVLAAQRETSPKESLPPNPQTEIEKHLASVWSWVLNIPIEGIHANDSFLRLGGDSVSAMTVVSRCRHQGKISISVQDLLQAESLREAAERARGVALTEVPSDLNGNPDVPFDLTPIQQMFVSATSSVDYSQSFLLKARSKVDNKKLQEAFDQLVRRHAMLRARFQWVVSSASWQQRVVPFQPDVYILQFWDRSTLDDIYDVNAQTRKALDMIKGPVFAANAFLDKQGSEQIIFLTAHHMIIDLVSWRIILRDLEEFFSGSVGPVKEAGHLSFQAWARLQSDFVGQLPIAETNANVAVQPSNPSYWGMGMTLSTFDMVDAARFELSSETTAALLGPCNLALSTEPLDLLLGVAMHAFALTFPDRAVPTFFTESHGRESWHSSIDPSETVGWFTTMYPVAVPSGRFENVKILDTIAGAKDARRRFQDKGFSWFSSRFLESNNDKSIVRGRPVELIFNYFGMYQQLEREGAFFTPLNVREMQPTEEGGAGTVRMSLLEMDVAVYENKLQVSLLFDRRMKHQSQLRQFMNVAQSLFEDTAQHLPKMQRTLTASDAPMMGLDHRQLDQLVHMTQTYTGLSAANIENIYPCTSMQEDLLTSQAKNLGYYDTRLVWKAESTKHGAGAINAGRLASAWQQLCKRHAILRSIMLPDPFRAGRWLQIVAKDTMPTDGLVQSPVLGLDEVLAVIERDPAPDYNSPRPRHRVKIWRTTDNVVVCQIDISHVLIDGAATEAFIKDWMACYNGTARRQVPKYESYVAYLQSNPRKEALKYWMDYAKGMPAFKLLQNHPITPPPENTGRSLRVKQVMRIPASQLSRCCETYQVTSACIFRTAWAMTLRMYGGSEDVAFGYLAHGRDAPVESALDIVGPMVVTLPFRARITKDTKPAVLLQETQKDMMKSLGAQSVSWGEIQRASGQWNSRPFDTLVNYRKAVEPTDDKSSEFSFMEIYTHDPMDYTAVVEIEQGGEDARVCLNYWEPDLDEPTVSSISRSLENALVALL